MLYYVCKIKQYINREVNKMRFANIEQNVIDRVLEVEIEEVFVSAKAVREVRAILELDDKTIDEMRAIRNTIVRTIADMEQKAIDNNDKKLFSELATKMSGITCVIDNIIWRCGGKV